ncbi:MAG: NUDIX domain-containing protein [Pseudomonadales bacterium]|nr:NUDIX domain-containing protein [Pseudomonadales bacterium]NRA16603.1 NUDIX domain-containing protein [Oceanospirillaceae bacterium]
MRIEKLIIRGKPVADYISQLRGLIGHRELLVPGARVVIINEQQQVLLELRSDFNVWGLPGGSADPGENIDQTIKRETFEETGLVISDVLAFGFSSSPEYEKITFPNKDKIQSFNLLFYCTKYSGKISFGSNESKSVQWFSMNELPAMLPNMQRTITAYITFVETGQFQLY